MSPDDRGLSPTPLDELSDETLLGRARDGDAAAFSEFVRRHTPAVHRWMARAVGAQEAEDLTQDVFVKAFRGLPRFRGDAPARAWLAAIADNAVKNRYRALSRFRRIFSAADPEGRDVASSVSDPERSAGADESRRLVAEALKRIAPDYRMPLVLRDLEEWSYDEIAASLGLPLGTVKSRIARARGQLRAILAPVLRRSEGTS